MHAELLFWHTRSMLRPAAAPCRYRAETLK
jgi:hypothetical protein